MTDLPIQRAIVAEIEAEQALANANREPIRRLEGKVKATIDRVWARQIGGFAGGVSACRWWLIFKNHSYQRRFYLR